MPALPRQNPPSVVAEPAVAPERTVAPQTALRARNSARDIAWSTLMARAQSGDAGAYRRLLEEIVPYLRALVARWCRDRQDAEDTVQDVLLTLHTIRHSYDPNRPFTPWVVAIAKRRAIDRLRRQGRSRRVDAALRADHETFDAPQANIDEAGPRGDALRRAVEMLPPGQRRAVTLLKLQEMSLKQAAAASGMSIASLKVAMHRALKNLRKMLGRMSGKS
jgi:RNA polymerase sigma-70 factor, ECF subfamily